MRLNPFVSGSLRSLTRGIPSAPAVALTAAFTLLFAMTLAHAAQVQGSGPAQPVPSEALHHVFRLSPSLLSGAAPENDAAFKELKRLGVRIVVSVDGTKPDLEAARRHGLRYVHLPIGYDRVPSHRWPELLAVAHMATNGAIFLHCHHGKHRGPAAAAVLCLASEGWSKDRALEYLKQAGTGAEYEGLFQSVRTFQPPAPSSVPEPHRLPELAPTSSLVDAMVEIDHHFELLKAGLAARWQAESPSNLRDWARAATLLSEGYQEIARLPDSGTRAESYHTQLGLGIDAAKSLAALLRQTPVESTNAQRAMNDLTQSCKACHKAHRN